MCTSPLHLVRPQFGFNLDVPCNDCLECRNASQDSWVFRLGSDLKELYANKGFAVFSRLLMILFISLIQVLVLMVMLSSVLMLIMFHHF